MGIEILGNGKKNLIWGCGNNGKRLLIAFLYFGYKIEGFCDSDRDKQGITVLNNFCVISVEQALADKEQYNFIISPENYLEIIRKIEQYEISDYISIEELRPFMQQGYSFELSFLHKIICWSRAGDKIILYGHGEDLNKLRTVLTGINVAIAYCIDDRPEIKVNLEEGFVNISKLRNEDVNNVKLIITSPNGDKINNTLEEYGFTYSFNYFCVNEIRLRINRWCLDPLLGFTRTDNYGNARSVIKYGEDEAEKKIVILGDSTVDSDLFFFKLWPEILSEKLKRAGKDVIILEGGVGSYRSSQQLIKLERDILPMNPDCVIQYCGVIDAVQDLFYPYLENHYFIHPHQIRLFNKLISDYSFEKNMGGSLMSKTVFCGLENNISKAECFLNNIRMASAVCKAFKVEYKYYMPPILASKKEFSILEKEMICNRNIATKLLDECKEFFEEVSDKLRVMNTVPYSDLSKALNHMENVFIDHCHITQEGNERIADIIFQDIIKQY